MNSKIRTVVFGGLLAMSIQAVASEASATVLTCTPTEVAWDASNGGGAFNVLCNNVWYNAWVSNTPIEVMKMFSSLAQSAILAGKQLKLDVGGGRVYWMDLIK